MKQEQLFKNLDSAVGEARGMLDTLEAVKGPVYAGVVHKMLIASQMTDLVQVLAMRISAQEHRLTAHMMARSIAEGIGVILADYAGLAGIDPDRQEELIADCERIVESTRGLIKGAHVAAVNGTGFGDSNAY